MSGKTYLIRYILTMVIGMSIFSYLCDRDVAKFINSFGYEYIPFVYNEKSILEYKVDKLKDLKYFLEAKSSSSDKLISEIQNNISDYESSYKLSDNSLEKKHLENLIKVQKKNLDKVQIQKKAIDEAIIETKYLIIYAENNLRMISNKSERKEIIEKINNLKSRTSIIENH